MAGSQQQEQHANGRREQQRQQKVPGETNALVATEKRNNQAGHEIQQVRHGSGCCAGLALGFVLRALELGLEVLAHLHRVEIEERAT